MKKMLLAACMVALLACVIALAGCAGGSTEKAKEAFAGTWTVEGSTNEGVNDLIAVLDAAGEKLTVELSADGKMSSPDALGSGTWELTNANEGTLHMGDGDRSISLKDGKLIIADADGEMVLAKSQ